MLCDADPVSSRMATKDMKHKKLLVGGGVVAIAGAGWLLATVLLPSSGAKASADGDTGAARAIAAAKERTTAKEAARARRIAERPRTTPRNTAKTPPKLAVADANLSPRDRACVEAIQAALDDNDYARLMPSINTAAKSASPDVRAQAVEALRWFGKAALSELTLFMADADDDVRTSACDAWTSALFEVEDPALKGKLVESAMEILTDADQLESMIMEINDLPEAQQVDILTRLIEGSNKAAADAAREHYEFVTGEPYESRDAAQKWLLENSADSVDEFEAQP